VWCFSFCGDLSAVKNVLYIFKKYFLKRTDMSGKLVRLEHCGLYYVWTHSVESRRWKGPGLSAVNTHSQSLSLTF